MFPTPQLVAQLLAPPPPPRTLGKRQTRDDEWKEMMPPEKMARVGGDSFTYYVGLRTWQDLAAVNLQYTGGECKAFDFVLKSSAKKIGEGSYGKTYSACSASTPADCNYIAKVVEVKESQTKQHNFVLEAFIGYKMGEAKIGPKVYAAFFCLDERKERIAVMVMEKMEHQLRNKQPLTLGVWNKLFPLVNELHNTYGIIHNDLYPRNIMWKNPIPGNQNPEKYEYRLIDFGSSIILKDLKCCKVEKLAEWFDLILGEAGQTYKHPLAFADESVEKKVWNDLTRNYSSKEIAEAVAERTPGVLPNNFGNFPDMWADATQAQANGQERNAGTFYIHVLENIYEPQAKVIGYHAVYRYLMHTKFTSLDNLRKLLAFMSQRFKMPITELEKIFRLPQQQPVVLQDVKEPTVSVQFLKDAKDSGVCVSLVAKGQGPNVLSAGEEGCAKKTPYMLKTSVPYPSVDDVNFVSMDPEVRTLLLVGNLGIWQIHRLDNAVAKIEGPGKFYGGWLDELLKHKLEDKQYVLRHVNNLNEKYFKLKKREMRFTYWSDIASESFPILAR